LFVGINSYTNEYLGILTDIVNENIYNLKAFDWHLTQPCKKENLIAQNTVLDLLWIKRSLNVNCGTTARCHFADIYCVK
jgi:hypothetical protein